MMEYQPFVYGLYDSAEIGHVRYVGMAPSNASRPYTHAKRAKSSSDDTHVMRWIRKIQREGRDPSVLVLEKLPEGTSRHYLGFIESCYIKSLREIGHRLTNENDGGWGGSNGPHTSESHAAMRAGWTPEVRARVGASSRSRLFGKLRSKESCEKQSRTISGRQLSDVHRHNIGSSRKAAWDTATDEERANHALRISNAAEGRPGHPQTEETRDKISQALTGRVMSEEWRAKNAAAQTGKKQSEETKAKRRASIRASWVRRKGGV